MLKKLFTAQINSITMAATFVAFSSLLSRLLGIFRDRILAGQFGAGDVLDIYYAAFRIPDFIFNLLILGALSAGFIPIFTTLIDKGKTNKEKNLEAWKFVSNIINIIGFCLIIISIIGIGLSPLITKLITPGFTIADQRITSGLTRIMFFSPLFLGISGVIGGVLQSAKRFFVYSLAPIFYNIGIIIGAIYFVPIWGIYGLAWGVVLGALMHMAVQIPSLFHLGFRYSFYFNFKDRNFKDIMKMMIPRTFSLATTQINLLMITVVASTLASGSLAIFNFASNLQTFAIGIFGISFAIAAFPTLSAHAFDKVKLKETFSSTTRQILFFIIPSMVLLYTLRAQIIRVVLGTGEFDWNDTVLTIDSLGYFTFSLFAQAIIPLLVRVYYARHDSKTPFVIGLVSDGINVFLSYILGHRMGVSGLALAFSISSLLYFIMLWAVLYSEIGQLDEKKIIHSSLKFLAAAIVAGGLIQMMKIIIWPLIDMTKTVGVFIQGSIAGILGIVAYLLVCYLLESEELFGFWAGVKRRMNWKKVEAGDQGEARGI